MERITSSILIRAPADKIFTFVEQLEPRIRLSPTYRVTGFEKLTDGAIGPGTRFRVVLESGGAESRYETEVVAYEENRRFATRETGGRLRVDIMLEETEEGTRYTHTEEFVIPEGMLGTSLEDARYWWALFLTLFTWPWGTNLARERKREDLLRTLREGLEVFLLRIKHALEER